ncbi:MAG TPA: acetyl-CoA carboxylase biotin carboxyl carrier protein [Bacteroidia bacterium]|nr:acetyl-CoA carboxylase biotin carboxyl carrier protein [Bacteroidia bacterium]
MDLPEIEKLIKFVQNSGVSEVSLEQKDFKITIKTTHGAMVMPAQVSQVPHIVHTPAPAPVSAAAAPSVASAPKETPVSGDEGKYITIKSPMIGTFYRSSTPEKPVFANVGDEIKPGKVLCIIEAMKLFNEIESEVSGKIIKVLVDNATPVEYDQPLFLIDPS